MKKILNTKLIFLGFAGIISMLTACKQENEIELVAIHSSEPIKAKKTFNKENLSPKFKDYWYKGEAEIS